MHDVRFAIQTAWSRILDPDEVGDKLKSEQEKVANQCSPAPVQHRVSISETYKKYIKEYLDPCHRGLFLSCLNPKE